MSAALDKNAIAYLYQLDHGPFSSFNTTVDLIVKRRDYASLCNLLDFALSSEIDSVSKTLLLSAIPHSLDRAHHERHFGTNSSESPTSSSFWSASAEKLCKKLISVAKKDKVNIAPILEAALCSHQIELAISAYKILCANDSQGYAMRVVGEWGSDASVELIHRLSASGAMTEENRLRIVYSHLQRKADIRKSPDWNAALIVQCLPSKDKLTDGYLNDMVLAAVDKGCVPFFEKYPEVVKANEHLISDNTDPFEQTDTILSRMTRAVLNRTLAYDTWREALYVLISPPIGLDVNFQHQATPLLMAIINESNTIYESGPVKEENTKIRHDVILTLMEAGADPHLKIQEKINEETNETNKLSVIDIASDPFSSDSVRLMHSFIAKKAINSVLAKSLEISPVSN
jgi:hypothetical protein